MNEKSCAFTGHRPKYFPWGYNETDERCIKLKAALAEQIVKLIDAYTTDFLSGMAEGTDIWAAETVLAMREKNTALQLHCILPCEGQEDKWPVSAQERYQSVLKRADNVIYVSRKYHKDCMLDRNRWLVDHAAQLLAVYNGRRRSGTASTMYYAKNQGRKIIILNPLTLEITHEI